MKLKNNDEAVSPVIGVILMVALVVFLAAVIAAFIFAMPGNRVVVNPSNNPLYGEIINSTVVVQPSDREFVTISLPGPGTYEIFAKTTGRGMSAVLGYSFDYWQNTSSVDKFGIKWNNATKTNNWYIWYSGGKRNGNLGTTDDISDIDRIFAILPDQMSPRISIVSSEVNRESTTKSIVHILVIPSNLPKTPSPPSIGSIVKCSDYSDRNTAQQWGSSDGSSWLDAFGSSSYSLSITDKYATYTFPTNLTSVNGTDTCKVIP